MATLTTKALIAQLARTEGRAEIINNQIVHFPYDDFVTSLVRGEIRVALDGYIKQTRSGYALGSTVAFIVDLPHRKSFCPHVAFYTGGELVMGFPVGAPIFAVEVRNSEDYGAEAEKAIIAKRADYFAAGTLVVWDVDTIGSDVIRSYHADAPDEPLIFRRGDIAHAEPALQGWTMKVDDMFP
jgi:Uma2 family endonuclease